MLNKDSALVKIFVEQVRTNKLTIEQIVPLELRILVQEVLEDGKI